MSEEQHVGSDKSQFLNAPKRTEVAHSSGLSKLGPRLKKLFSLRGNRKVEAEHVIIPADRVAKETAVHPLNPRNQEALTTQAVRDILEEIKDRGVDVEGVAIRRNGIYLIIEGSRRRFCCIHALKDLPLWVLPDELSDDDVASIIKSSQATRRFSYREVGLQYIQTMKEHGFKKNEELAIYLGISHVSVSKRVQAAQIEKSLLTIFPDYEGIPNAYYSKLHRLQKLTEKSKCSLREVIDKVKKGIENLNIEDVTELQKRVMEKLTFVVEHLDEKPTVKGWKTQELASFENKDKYARISVSASGRKTRFEFNRLSNELIADIEAFIKDKLSSEK